MFPDSFGRLVVGYAGQKASVVLDLPVEFNALVTHRHFRIRANLPYGLIASWLSCSNVRGVACKKILTGRRGTQDESRIGIAAGPNAE
jgi:hypothetical protein